MAGDFYSWFYQLEGLGFFDIILPFLLVFSISFAIFEKLKIFGDKKGVNVVVSLAIGALVIRNPIIVGIIQSFLPKVSLVLVVILMFLMLFGVFANKEHEWKGSALTLAFIFAIIAILWSLFYEFGYGMPYWMQDLTSSQDIGMLLFIGVFIIVIVWITASGKEENTAPRDFGKFVKQMFK